MCPMVLVGRVFLGALRETPSMTPALEAPTPETLKKSRAVVRVAYYSGAFRTFSDVIQVICIYYTKDEN